MEIKRFVGIAIFAKGEDGRLELIKNGDSNLYGAIETKGGEFHVNYEAWLHQVVRCFYVDSHGKTVLADPVSLPVGECQLATMEDWTKAKMPKTIPRIIQIFAS